MEGNLVNKNKICFISCVNDERLYTEALKYVDALAIPEGIEVETICIRDAKSMTSGYNEAMKKTDAKYKVYLHQDTLIINKNFISDVINLFQRNSKLGLLGVVGANEMPPNGVWWDAERKSGMLYDSHTGIMEHLSFSKVYGEYTRVELIDGLILVTQEDIIWREDLFDGWHFYDSSQCQEFIRTGLQVGVVKQEKPWCIHACGAVNVKNGFDQYREIFYNEYVKERLPLVSVLTPAYNRPELLKIGLESVLAQTYQNIEIIICDDSTNDEVEKMIQLLVKKHSHLQYHRNEVRLIEKNWHKLMDLATGEYIAFLMDDDLFHETKIEKMIKAFESNPKATLVTSYRKMIDLDGELLPDTHNRPLFGRDTVVSGKELGTSLIMNLYNGIGEPTTAMFRKRDLSEKFGVLDGFVYSSLNDFATWVALMAKGDVVYINESLSFLRDHESQNQKKTYYIAQGIKQWLQLIKYSKKHGFLAQEKEYKKTLENYLKGVTALSRSLIEQGEVEILKEVEAEKCIAEATEILQGFGGVYECCYCGSRFTEFTPWNDMYDFPGHKFEMHNKYTYLCPSCHSMDRERLYKLYIETETDLLEASKKVLHIAPERNFRGLLMRSKSLDYTCGDLYPNDNLTKKVDITKIQYPDNTFDVVLCSHVLEHVPDDRLAMSEFYRVMKKGGWGILQVPIDVTIDDTYEDFSITTPEGRLKAFGQDDHVRLYEKNDYIRRLEEAGFEVTLYDYAQKHGIKEASKHGLAEGNNLYLVYKK